VGNQLLQDARNGVASESNVDDYLAMIEGWAAEFRIENYRPYQSDAGIVIQYERPTETLARNLELESTNTVLKLHNRHARSNDEPELWHLDTLAEDIAAARKLVKVRYLPTHYGPRTALSP
jgi:hypothetical protein